MYVVICRLPLYHWQWLCRVSIANMSIYEGELVEALQKSGSDPEWDPFHS